MQRNVNNRVWILLLCFSLFIVGCNTKRSAIGTSTMDMESMALFTSSPSVALPRTSLSGNLKMSVNIGGDSFSAKGTMRIKEGCGVQIGMTALGLIEVASLEFLPDNMRLIYKLGKEYTDIPYSEISFLQKTGIDYNMLESVLMNKAFSPDGRPFLQTTTNISYADEGSYVTATTIDERGITYKFYIDKANSELVQSEGIHANGGKVICRYSNFKTVDGTTFPHTILLTLEGVGSAVSLQFLLDKVDTDDFNFTPRRVSSSYDKLNLEQLLKSLGEI